MTDPFIDGDNPEQVKRLRNGRYYYPRPGEEHTGIDYAHTRVTTFVKVIADNFALEQWAIRSVMEGLVKDESLYLAACAAVGEEDPAERKRLLNGIAREAKALAGGDSGARWGTAWHTFTERQDRTGGPGHVPSWRRGKITSYLRALETWGLDVVPDLIERRVLIPEFGLIGTLDRVLLDRQTGALVVGDLKTQKELWTYVEIAIQLALYAGARWMWSEELQLWEPMPEVDRETAVVIWMPKTHPDGADEVTIEDVQIRRAFDFAARVCADARSWRNEGKNLGSRRPLPQRAGSVL